MFCSYDGKQGWKYLSGECVDGVNVATVIRMIPLHDTLELVFLTIASRRLNCFFRLWSFLFQSLPTQMLKENMSTRSSFVRIGGIFLEFPASYKL